MIGLKSGHGAAGAPSTPPGPAAGGPGGGDGEGPEVPTADGDPVPAPRSPIMDERVLLLIRYYSTPDRRGAGVMPPADLLYRLNRWHGAQITREQLAEALRMIRGGRS